MGRDGSLVGHYNCLFFVRRTSVCNMTIQKVRTFVADQQQNINIVHNQMGKWGLTIPKSQLGVINLVISENYRTNMAQIHHFEESLDLKIIWIEVLPNGSILSFQNQWSCKWCIFAVHKVYECILYNTITYLAASSIWFMQCLYTVYIIHDTTCMLSCNVTGSYPGECFSLQQWPILHAPYSSRDGRWHTDNGIRIIPDDPITSQTVRTSFGFNAISVFTVNHSRYNML